MKKYILFLLLFSFNAFSYQSFINIDKIEIKKGDDIKKIVKNYITNYSQNIYKLSYKNQEFYLYKKYDWDDTTLLYFKNEKEKIFIVNDRYYFKKNKSCDSLYLSPINKHYGFFNFNNVNDKTFNLEITTIKPYENLNLELEYYKNDPNFLPYYGNSYNIDLTNALGDYILYKFVIHENYIQVMERNMAVLFSFKDHAYNLDYDSNPCSK